MTNPVTYISTRGGLAGEHLGFKDIFLRGPAVDGGLYMPDHWPKGPILGLDEPYSAAAGKILHLFAGLDLPEEDCLAICSAAYHSFPQKNAAPLRELSDGFFLMELFHGPTLAFKDIAMQVLLRLFDRAVAKEAMPLTLLGATSGDTGSAAIAACEACNNVEIFILYPDGRPSNVQRLQMTTSTSPNVHALAVDGDFDACQNLVKALFADKELIQRKRLSTVNSINWVRIVMQSVYYALASLQLPNARFVVPSGNFGNLFSAFVAKSMGYKIGHLVAATNSNDALHQFFTTGKISARPTVPTLSPSMDIQIPSNLERYLFELLGHDPKRVQSYLSNGGQLDQEALAITRKTFSSGHANDAQTMRTMADFAIDHHILIDPHTAVGAAVTRTLPKMDKPTVLLATAHAAKFPEAVLTATGHLPEEPHSVKELLQKHETINRIAPDFNLIRQYILSQGFS